MKNIVCVLCPKSCCMQIDVDAAPMVVRNNHCLRGEDFAYKELTDPERTLTSTILVLGGDWPLVSVKSDRPVKKDELPGIIKSLDGIKLEAPVKKGQIVAQNMGKNKVNIVTTRSVGGIKGGYNG